MESQSDPDLPPRDSLADLPPAAVQELLELLAADDDERQRRIAGLQETLEGNGGGEVTVHAVAEGTQLGPFTLREKLGEGGMGLVFRAEQTEPIRREVAIKLVRPGVNSRGVLARFQVERQSLAAMRHPGIAAVVEAGFAPAELGSQPWFAMEFVDGEPITAYCDRHGLGIESRLALFAEVCDAVQHAHFRGVLHRDLKPGNVLAAEVDGVARAKVIDFGLARNAGESDETQLTRADELLGTPAYMSPEQLEPGQPAVDTRSDVYGLGCILYELMAGAPPIAVVGPDGTPRRFAELESAIRTELPKPPSTRIGAASPASEAVARCRGLDARSLVRALRGEIDWICRRAIAKEPERRYASAADLAADVRRMGTGERLEAGPESFAYLARKQFERHRVAWIGAALVFVSLVGGLVATSWQFLRATDAEAQALESARVEGLRADEAEDAERVTRSVTDFLVGVLSKPDPISGQIDVKVSEVLVQAQADAEERFAEEPEVLARILGSVGLTLREIGKWELAVAPLRRRVEVIEARARAERQELELAASGGDARGLSAEEIADRWHWATPSTRVLAMSDVAVTLRRLGRIEDAIEIYRGAEEIAKAADLEGRAAVLSMNLSVALESLGRGEESMAAAHEAHVMHQRAFPDEPERLAIVASHYASTLSKYGDQQAGLELQLEAVASMRKIYADRPHPYMQHALTRLSRAHRAAGDLESALETGFEGLEVAEAVYGPDHPNLIAHLGSLCVVLQKAGRIEDALELARRSTAIVRGLIARGQIEAADPRSLAALTREAAVWMASGNYESAEALLREAVPLIISRRGEEHPDVADRRLNWGRCLNELGRIDEAREQLLLASPGMQRGSTSSDIWASDTEFLAGFFTKHGPADEAERWTKLRDEAARSDR